MATFSAQQHEPKFSQPIRQIVTMLVIVLLSVMLGFVLYPTVEPVFWANPYLNGFILGVFVFGVGACFMQVFTLISSASWIEGFALDRPGHEFVRAPRLLAPLSALLRDTRARRALTSTSTRSILDSVAQRLDEARDITRYIVNLLIFLGLLGTFYGLATTVPAVVETIRSLAPDEGSDGLINFDKLMAGLESQLGGMGTAFASSLLGLAGSLIVGMLELFAGHGQNRFYSELEEWLSSITRISLSNDGDVQPQQQQGNGGDAGAMEHVAMQLQGLRDVVQRSEENRIATDTKLGSLADAVAILTRQMTETPPGGGAMDNRLLERLATSQERLTETIAGREDPSSFDAETRMRLRNIDVQLLRVLEEMSAGRQDAVAELRTELAGLTEMLRQRLGG